MTAAKAKPHIKIKKSSQKGSANERRRLFIEALLSNGENVTQAAVYAGFSPKSAASQGSRLLKNVKVRQALDSRRTEVLGKFQLTTERVTQEIARISFFDPRKMFAADVCPLESRKQIRNKQAATVDILESRTASANGQLTATTSVGRE